MASEDTEYITIAEKIIEYCLKTVKSDLDDRVGKLCIFGYKALPGLGLGLVHSAGLDIRRSIIIISTIGQKCFHSSGIL